MYACNLNFYLLGDDCETFQYIRQLDINKPFSKKVTQSGTYNSNILTDMNINVVIINAESGFDDQILNKLLNDVSSTTKVILMAGAGSISSMSAKLESFSAIWKTPLTSEEISFYFNSWLENHKTSLDLMETKHFLDATIENSPNLIWFKTRNGIHEKVNQVFCDTVHKTKDQVQGRGHAFIWNVEADDPACIESEMKVMSTKKQLVSTEVVEHSGDQKILKTYKSPLYDIDGSVMGTIGIGVDITENKAYEAEILKKANELENIFTNLNCGILRHTLDGKKMISINETALSMLGYNSKEEFLRDGFYIVAGSVVDEDKPKIQNAIRQLKGAGSSAIIEYRVRHKDDSVRHITGNIKLIEENGELICQRFMLDCTEQKIEEERQERFKASMFNALSIDYDFVYFYDLQNHTGEVVKQSEQGEKEFGNYVNNHEDMMSNMAGYIENCVYEEDKALVANALSAESIQEQLNNKDTYVIGYKAVQQDTLHWRRVKVVKVGHWGRHKRIVIGFRDIDAEVQEEFRQKELLETALLQANEASLAKSAFLANMSHDMRTPMNAIIGFTNLASTHINNKEKLKGYFDKIIASSNLLLSLIDGVLDIESIENGKIALAEENCKLSDIVHEITNLTQEAVKNKQLDFNIDVKNVINEEVYCDTLKLKQILLNIISNSIKYTNSGGRVNVTITEGTAQKNEFSKFTFTVKDNGIGISEEFLPHIFDAFEREKNTTMSGIQGTGLGMAITKKLVDIMQGTISISSEKDCYTEVTIEFTFKIMPHKNEVINIPRFHNSRTLIVNNSYTTCENLSYMLKQAGLRADFTLSGKEAVMKIMQASNTNDPYHIYMVDYSTEDMSGIEIIQNIRSTETNSRPVIIMTGNSEHDFSEEVKGLDIDVICDIPLFPSELKVCLEHAVKKEEKAAAIISGDNSDTEEAIISSISDKPILLVEDNELNQEIAMEILTMNGFHVEVADNGRIAIDKLLDRGPGYYQLILMDIQMPELNGYDTTKRIRALDEEQLSGIPIFAMTANALEEDKKKVIQYGMDGYITKPIDIDALLATLKEAIGKKRA